MTVVCCTSDLNISCSRGLVDKFCSAIVQQRTELEVSRITIGIRSVFSMSFKASEMSSREVEVNERVCWFCSSVFNNFNRNHLLNILK
jgi:hypothetical protein